MEQGGVKLAFTPVERQSGKVSDDPISVSLTEAARQDAMGHGRAALRHAADALTAIAKKYDLHGYATI